MRFTASFSDQGAIEAFSRCINAMAKMSRKKFIIRISDLGMCIITCPATGIAVKDGIEYWLGSLFSWNPTFMNVGFSGLNEENNEIVIEVDGHHMAHCLAANNANTKLRLCNRDGQPHLRIEVRALSVNHELPVTVIGSKKWGVYNRPNCEGEQAIVTLPPSRTLLRVLNSMKNIHCKFVTMKVSSEGDLQLSSAMTNGDLTVHFSDLSNDPISGMAEETQSQATWSQAKLYVKPVYNFFSQFIFTQGKFKLTVLNERAAEFALMQDDFEVSFVVGDISD